MNEDEVVYPSAAPSSLSPSQAPSVSPTTAAPTTAKPSTAVPTRAAPSQVPTEWLPICETISGEACNFPFRCFDAAGGEGLSGLLYSPTVAELEAVGCKGKGGWKLLAPEARICATNGRTLRVGLVSLCSLFIRMRCL